MSGPIACRLLVDPEVLQYRSQTEAGPMMNADDALPARVLIVDDNEQNVELLQAYLEEIEGTQSQVARDGLQALEAVAQDPPDLILLDIMMPNMSGFEVCKQLKENPTTRNIPIIVVTALNESSDYVRSRSRNARSTILAPGQSPVFFVTTL